MKLMLIFNFIYRNNNKLNYIKKIKKILIDKKYK